LALKLPAEITCATITIEESCELMHLQITSVRQKIDIDPDQQQVKLYVWENSSINIDFFQTDKNQSIFGIYEVPAAFNNTILDIGAIIDEISHENVNQSISDEKISNNDGPVKKKRKETFLGMILRIFNTEFWMQMNQVPFM